MKSAVNVVTAVEPLPLFALLRRAAELRREIAAMEARRAAEYEAAIYHPERPPEGDGVWIIDGLHQSGVDYAKPLPLNDLLREELAYLRRECDELRGGPREG